MTDIEQYIDAIFTEIHSAITEDDLSKLLMIGIHTGGVWIARARRMRRRGLVRRVRPDGPAGR